MHQSIMENGLIWPVRKIKEKVFFGVLKVSYLHLTMWTLCFLPVAPPNLPPQNTKHSSKKSQRGCRKQINAKLESKKTSKKCQRKEQT